MPILRYNGPSFYGRCPDPATADFTRGEEREVSQMWVDEWRRVLGEPKFTLVGDEGVTIDAGLDGIPDSGWRNSDIKAWLVEREVTISRGYTTKSGLLQLVALHLNPPAPTPVVVEAVEEIVEEVVEEPVEATEEITETTENDGE
jgi:hypothetical protein